MSDAIKYHYQNSNPLRSYCGRPYGGNRGGITTGNREWVQCKRCLAKLARMDAKKAARAVA